MRCGRLSFHPASARLGQRRCGFRRAEFHDVVGAVGVFDQIHDFDAGALQIMHQGAGPGAEKGKGGKGGKGKGGKSGESSALNFSGSLSDSGSESGILGSASKMSDVNWGHEPQYLHNVRKIILSTSEVSTIAGGNIRK